MKRILLSVTLALFSVSFIGTSTVWAKDQPERIKTKISLAIDTASAPSKPIPKEIEMPQTKTVSSQTAINQYLVWKTSVSTDQPSFVSPDPSQFSGQIGKNIGGLLPNISTGGWSIFPVIKTVYPTAEKPMVVVAFKCPTEAAFNISTPPIMLLHTGITLFMDAVNTTQLLPFTLTQLCS